MTGGGAADNQAFPAIRGEMAERVRAHDWASTPLGPICGWPQSLKSAVGIVLLSPVPIVMLWGEDGIMIYNDAYSVFAGGRHPQLLGSKVREGWPEVADFNDHVMKVGLAGGTLAYRDQELTLHRRGLPEQVWMNLDYSPILDESGKPAGVMAIVIETTDRVRADAALRRSEEQLRLATEYADVGLWDIDVVNDIVYWPPRVNAIFGLAPDAQVTMKQFRACIHPGDKRRTIGLILEACDPARRTFYDAEYRIVRPADGAVRWVAAKGRAIFDDNGICVRMLGIILDITARKETEQRLYEINETLERKVIERTQARGLTWQVTPDLMGALNSKGYFETSNPAWQTMLGWTEEEVARMSIFELLHPDDLERTRAGFNLTQIGQPAIRFPNRYRCKDGSYRWISWVGVPEDGMVYCTGRDITEEKAAEAELLKAQDALRQAQKMEAIGNLTGGIAHDFNNLLQGVAGSLDLIRRRPDNAERVQRWAEAGLQAAERGAKLTAQLLAFSRSQKLEVKPIDLSALLEEMRDLLLRTLGPSVRVVLDLQDGAKRVLCDETQLEMSVLNLAINARDAMPLGGDLIIMTQRHRIARDPDLEAGEYMELAVSDSGTGMPADIVQRAFDPFFTTKGVGKGTGLGLSQVYGMARQAGGTARIRSEPGQGHDGQHLPATDRRRRCARCIAPRQGRNGNYRSRHDPGG